MGHKAGHGDRLGTVGGIIAGAVGAHELERGYEKRRDRKREDPYGGEKERRGGRRSSGVFEGLREKVEGLLSPGGGEEKRRSKSHGEGGRRRGDRDGYSSEEEERYERRGGSGRRGRDDYY